MRNIKFPVALLCLFFTIQMMAQSPSVRKFSKTSYILQTAQVMPTNAVADDFGPRNLGETYWHGGIDFNSIQNDGHAGCGQKNPSRSILSYIKTTYTQYIYIYIILNEFLGTIIGEYKKKE